MDEKRVILTGRQSGKTAQMLQAAYDENYLLRQKLAKSEARVAEHEEEMELFTAAAVMICQQESDEWDSDSLQTYKDYAEVCGQRIAKLTPANARAWLLRKQAEAVEQIVDADPDGRSEDGAALISVNEIWDYAQSLRQQADEAERAGGEK